MCRRENERDNRRVQNANDVFINANRVIINNNDHHKRCGDNVRGVEDSRRNHCRRHREEGVEHRRRNRCCWFW